MAIEMAVAPVFVIPVPLSASLGGSLQYLKHSPSLRRVVEENVISFKCYAGIGGQRATEI